MFDEPIRDGVILISGGLDSVSLLHILKHKNPDIKLYALNMYYGQRHKKEQEYCKYNCDLLNVPYIEYNLQFYNDIIKDVSAMVGNNDLEVPDKEYDPNEVPITYAPFRNALFTIISAVFCETHKLNTIYCAIHRGDSESNYWDCSPEFVTNMNSLLFMRSIRLIAPFMNIKKADIVKLGSTIPTLDFSKTWSCYNGGEKHCGHCSTCRERILSFKTCNIEDPTEYLDNPYK